MEVIDLGDLDPIRLDLNNNSSTDNFDFDSGVEFLMNDKRKKSSTNNVEFSNINDLEKELNDLSNPHTPSNKTVSGFGNWFNFSAKDKETEKSKNPDIFFETSAASNIGIATKESISGNTKTWDGFTKINEVPQRMEHVSAPTTERDRRKKKRIMIKKLEEWFKKGLIDKNPNFNLDSPFEEVEDEYECALEEKKKDNAIKFQASWLKNIITSVEFLNTTFDPFGLDLGGFGEQVEEDMDSYDEIFGELYEKYKGGKLAPEISLLLKLGITAATINVTNKAMSRFTPGVQDIIKQSPEIMKIFTDATVNAMSQNSPGIGFASNIVNEPEMAPKRSQGPPPAPVDTRTETSAPPRRPGTMEFTERPNLQRPDISQARGTMFRESGVELNSNYQSVSNQPQQFQQQPQFQAQQQPPPQSRPEMRGPSADIDNFLFGLKKAPTTSVATSLENEDSQRGYNIHGDDSMVSIASLKDLQNTKMPKQSKRRNKSEKNIISLDI